MIPLVWLLHLIPTALFVLAVWATLEFQPVLTRWRGVPGMSLFALLIEAFGILGVQLQISKDMAFGLSGSRLIGWWLRYHAQLLAIILVFCGGLLLLFNAGRDLLEPYLGPDWTEDIVVFLAACYMLLVGGAIGWLAQRGYLNRSAEQALPPGIRTTERG